MGFYIWGFRTKVTWLCDGKIILRIGAVEIGIEACLLGAIPIRVRVWGFRVISIDVGFSVQVPGNSLLLFISSRG